MNTKVLVTGANSQLARTILELFAQKNQEITFTFLTKEELDITSENDIASEFNRHSYQYCINCAAYTNVEKAETDEKNAYLLNAKAVENLAKACSEYKVTLIHISTDYVFDGTKRSPYAIDDKPNPINVYGKSKLLGETFIQAIGRQYFIIRTSWLYSKKYGNNFYRTILRKAVSGETIHVTNAQTGCPTNTESLATYIYDIISTKSKSYGIKHFTDNEPMTWYEFARRILKENQFDQNKLIKDNTFKTIAKRPNNSILSLTST